MAFQQIGFKSQRFGLGQCGAGHQAVAVGAKSSGLLPRLCGQGDDDLAILHAAAKHHAVEAGHAVLGIDAAGQLAAAVQQVGVLFQTVIDRPIFEDPPRLVVKARVYTRRAAAAVSPGPPPLPDGAG